MKGNDQKTCAFLLSISIAILSWFPVSKIRVSSYRISLNDADVQELQCLPSVGYKRAKNIYEYRNIFGPYHNLDDCLLVPSLGYPLLKKIEPHLQKF